MPARRATAMRKPSSSSRQGKEQYQVFGKHLTIDAYGISQEKLRSHKGVFDLLDELPRMLGMRKLTTPYVVFCQEGDKQGEVAELEVRGVLVQPVEVAVEPVRSAGDADTQRAEKPAKLLNFA